MVRRWLQSRFPTAVMCWFILGNRGSTADRHVTWIHCEKEFQSFEGVWKNQTDRFYSKPVLIRPAALTVIYQTWFNRLQCGRNPVYEVRLYSVESARWSSQLRDLRLWHYHEFASFLLTDTSMLPFKTNRIPLNPYWPCWVDAFSSFSSGLRRHLARGFETWHLHRNISIEIVANGVTLASKSIFHLRCNDGSYYAHIRETVPWQNFVTIRLMPNSVRCWRSARAYLLCSRNCKFEIIEENRREGGTDQVYYGKCIVN